MPITYTWHPNFEHPDIRALYAANGWTAYLKDWDKTRRALAASQNVAALDGKHIVGLLRTISDGETIMYIQDLLVHPDYQRRGIGTELLTQVLAHYPAVGQIVLIGEATDQARNFYRKQGFATLTATYGTAFVLDRR